MRHVAVFYMGPQMTKILVDHIKSDLVPRKGDWIKIDKSEVGHEVLAASLNLFKNRVEVVIEDPN
jgi:hypothetical protein